MKLRKLTRSSFLCALSVALLYTASMFPTLSLTIAAVAGLMPKAAQLYCGRNYGAMAYAVSSLLALLMAPEKDIALLYTVFFGCYPLLKDLFETPDSKALRWAVKLVYFNSVFCALWFLARALVFGETPLFAWYFFALWAFLNVFFVVFDTAIGRLLGGLFYIRGAKNL